MPGPHHLLLAAGPAAPGARDLLERFRAVVDAEKRVLLAGEGLAWARGDARDDLGAGAVCVCSQDARARGWSVDDAPAGVRWSSVGTWLAEVPEADELWIALP